MLIGLFGTLKALACPGAAVAADVVGCAAAAVVGCAAAEVGCAAGVVGCAAGGGELALGPHAANSEVPATAKPRVRSSSRRVWRDMNTLVCLCQPVFVQIGHDFV